MRQHPQLPLLPCLGCLHPDGFFDIFFDNFFTNLFDSFFDNFFDSIFDNFFDNLHINKIILCFRDSVRSFYSSRLKYAIRGTGILERFVRAPASGGGSNAPRSAVSVPHIDVNTDGCRAIKARSCKNTACRGEIPKISVVSSCLQRLDDLQNWPNFQTVVANVLNFCGGILSSVCFAYRLQGLSVCLFCLTSAGLERMKHVLRGRLKRPSPCRTRSAPGRNRVRGLSETSEK